MTTINNKIDCAYIFYTTDDIKTINKELSAEAIDLMCDYTHGILRTKGIICTDNKSVTITSQGGERLGINTPEFTSGVKVYAIAVVSAGITQKDDVLLMYTELTDPAIVPAGTNIIVTVNY